jgi:hypothetical protein
VRREELYYLTDTLDGEKIFGFKKDLKEICRKCPSSAGCFDLEDGCGCLTAFCELCWRSKQLVYESDLKEDP